MRTSDFSYDLPPECIAQTPAEPRDSSRMLVYDRANRSIDHRIFRDIAEYLRPGDVLVVNETKVIPARLIGKREDTGVAMEFLLLRRLSRDRWETLVNPGRRAIPGRFFVFGEPGSAHCLRAEVISTTPENGRIVEFQYEGAFEEHLDALGQMPLPPYIHEQLADGSRYQTVYAREEGSAAAPTAGLHFTQELLGRIERMGVERVSVLLHVGLGTFRPVKAEDIESHKMHEEEWEITEESARRINEARANGGRIICVGTTTVRTLETASYQSENQYKLSAGKGSTGIFIYPGYKFKMCDALITNFHLPESTLLMLVSAFMGRDEALLAYKTAIDEGYRFFSFGDCMVIL